MKIEAGEGLAEHLGIPEEKLQEDLDKLNHEIKEDMEKNQLPKDGGAKVKVEF